MEENHKESEKISPCQKFLNAKNFAEILYFRAETRYTILVYREFDGNRKVSIMRGTMEIRWHGRGGQGAKTAALLLADVAFSIGKYVQGFPEYGPERMGAPITAFNRVSDNPIRVHSNIYHPDYVVVVDETLLHTVEVTAGLKEDGAIIVNTARTAEEIRPSLGDYAGQVYTVDARRISEETLGRYYPNSPMLAAVVAVSRMMPPNMFLIEMEKSFQHKFENKPEIIRGNMAALRMTFETLDEERQRKET